MSKGFVVKNVFGSIEANVKTVTQVCRACADDGVGAEGTVLEKKMWKVKQKARVCVCLPECHNMYIYNGEVMCVEKNRVISSVFLFSFSSHCHVPDVNCLR